MLTFFVMNCYADNNAPFYPRDVKNNTDLGGINQNFQDITSRNKDNLVTAIADNACAANYALTGATQKNGYIFGGTCTLMVSSGSIPAPNSYYVRDSSVSISAVTAATVPLNSLYNSWDCTYSFTNNTTGGNVTLNFNNDYGSKYRWDLVQANSGGGAGELESTSDNKIQTGNTNVTITAGKIVSGKLWVIDEGGAAGVSYTNGYLNSLAAPQHIEGNGEYTNGSPTSIILNVSAGTLTGKLSCAGAAL